MANATEVPNGRDGKRNGEAAREAETRALDTPSIDSTGSIGIKESGDRVLNVNTSNPSNPPPVAGYAYDIALGQSGTASAGPAVAGSYRPAIAIGTPAIAQGYWTISIGLSAGARSEAAIALGAYSSASGQNSIAIGRSSTSSGNNSVVVGFSASTTGVNSAVFGANASSGGASLAVGFDASTGGSSTNANAGSYNTAIGNTAKVTQRNISGVPTNSSNSSAIGYGATVSGTGSNALGNAATVNAGSGTALGHVSRVLADNGTAIGATAQVTANGTSAVALGAGSVADTANTVSIGTSAIQRRIVNVGVGMNSNDAVNLGQLNSALAAKADDARVKVGGTGTATISGRPGNIAIGNNAESTGIATNSATIALGENARATGIAGAMALGTDTEAAAQAAIALGLRAKASATNGIAVGLDSNVTAQNAVALGNGSSADRENTVSVGSAARQRQIANVANGTQATDAVNLRQLDNVDGRVTTLNTTVDGIGVQVANNSQEITQIRADLNGGAIGLVQQASAGADLTVGKATDGPAVNFTSTVGDRKLTGVGEGELSSASNDAVNGKQLNATNVNVNNLSARVDGVDTRVTNNEAAVTNIRNEIGSGSLGLVHQDPVTKTITVAADSAGSLTNFAGTEGVRRLTGVDEGELSSSSNDAVNGKQLNATNVSVKTLSNRVDGVDARVTNNETAVTNIRNELGSGEVGLVRQDPDTNAITVAADRAGTSANFAGAEGARKLRGVAEGELSSASNDAVNGKQLNATNVDVKNLSTRVNGIDARVTNNETAITNIRRELASGEVGLVRQDPLSNTITVAADHAGASANFAGTEGARRLMGVADGELSTASTHAVNGSQLHATNEAVDNNTADIAKLNTDMGELTGRVTIIEGNVTTIDAKLNELESGTAGLVQQASAGANLTVGAATNGAAVDLRGTGGERRLTGVADGVQDADAVNRRQMNAALATKVDNRYVDVKGLGHAATASANSIALGNAAVAGPDGGNVAATAIGYAAKAPGEGATALGRNTEANAWGTIAVGWRANATPQRAIAIGSSATAGAENSIALGFNSVANLPNTLSVGSTAQLRQIVNVADGEQLTDAATIGQLRAALLAESERVTAELSAQSAIIAQLRAEILALQGRLNAG